MSEPAPKPVEAVKEAPAPVAPALAELFELSLIALVNAPGTFGKLADRPTPAPVSSFLVALAWGAAFFALNLVHVSIANPAALSAYPAWQLAAVTAAGFGAWIALYLLGASFTYGLGKTLGSGGDFERALLVCAFALGAAPVSALCSWAPAAWFAPAVLAAWIAACGLAALFKADVWAARGLCAILAAGAIGLQYVAGSAVERYSGAAQLAALAAQAGPQAAQLSDLQRQMEQVQAASDEAAKSLPAAQPGQSSLDLLRGPAGNDAPAPVADQRQQIMQMKAQGEAVTKSAVNMLDAMEPMLNNPLITQNMNAQQKADYVQLKGMIKNIRTEMAAGKITSQQEQQEKMMKIQQLVMRMMSSGLGAPKTQAAPAPDAGARK